VRASSKQPQGSNCSSRPGGLPIWAISVVGTRSEGIGVEEDVPALGIRSPSMCRQQDDRRRSLIRARTSIRARR